MTQTIYYVVLSVSILALLFAIYTIAFPTQQTSTTNPTQTSTYDPITTGTTNQGDVEITLQPQKGEKLTISMSANTHSIDLSKYNLAELVTLNDLQKPIQSPTLSGHHAQGQLVFEKPETPTLTVKIKGIPQQQERVYTWTTASK
jgi:hypothetical protein